MNIFDTSKETVTIDGATYDVERHEDAPHPIAYTLTVEEFPEVRVEVHYDECPESPREDYTLGTTIVAWHRRSNLGDEGFNYRDICAHMGDSQDDLIDWLKSEHGALVIKPLYLYEHSGQTISLSPFHDPWDSGQVGFVFVNQKHLDDTGGDPEQMIEADVEEYDRYLRGEVYFIVGTGAGYDESCGGFIGHKYAETTAYEEFLIPAIEATIKERSESAEWAARDTVTI